MNCAAIHPGRKNKNFFDENPKQGTADFYTHGPAALARDGATRQRRPLTISSISARYSVINNGHGMREAPLNGGRGNQELGARNQMAVLRLETGAAKQSCDCELNRRDVSVY